jgi:hypothetical protein
MLAVDQIAVANLDELRIEGQLATRPSSAEA